QALNAILNSLLQRSSAGSKISFCAESESKELILTFTGHSIQISNAHIPFLFGPLNAETVRNAEQGREIELGLYIAYEIVLAHGGRMWTVNSSGSGLTIYLTLPAARESAIPVDTSGPGLAQNLQSPTQNHTSDKQKKSRATPLILLVEDDFEMT